MYTVYIYRHLFEIHSIELPSMFPRMHVGKCTYQRRLWKTLRHLYLSARCTNNLCALLFCSSLYYSISLNIKFGMHQTFHVPQTPVYQCDLYGRYQILWTDIAHFQYQFNNTSLCVKSIAHCVWRYRVYHIRTNGRTDISQISSNFALI